jgi:broad specificity phosphatase PhoE
MNPARRLILIKHSLPDIQTGVPANTWSLSDEGRRRAERLAHVLAAYRPGVIVTSREPKAAETGRIVAHSLGLPCVEVDDLHEHSRATLRHLSKQEFEERVRELFARPAELMMGEETADAAHDRFARAVAGVLARYPAQDVAVIAHGTVISLFVSRALGMEPLPLWQRLGLPAVVVLDVPVSRLLELIDEVV